MKNSSMVRALNVLIIVSIILAVGSLAALALTVVQTVQTISLDEARKPSFSFIGTAVVYEIPVTLRNPGPLAVSSLSLMLAVRDAHNDTILDGYNGPFTVPAGRAERLIFSVDLDLSQAPAATLSRLLTTTENLTISAFIQAQVPPLAEVTGRVFAILPWGAPIGNLQIGGPSLAIHNSTHFLVKVPISFENNSTFIDVDAVLDAEVINATSGLLAGAGRLNVQAMRGHGFSGDLDLYLRIPIQFETLFFHDASLNYTVTISTAIIGVPVAVSRDFHIEWGAPVKNLLLGPLSTQAHNSSHARISLPFGLRNNSDIVALVGEVYGAVLDPSMNRVGTIDTYVLNVNPGGSLSDQFSGFVELSALGEESLTFVLIFQTAYGSFSRQVQVGA